MSKFGSLRKLPSGKIQARYNHQSKTHKAPETFSTRRRATAWLAEEEKLIEFDEWTPPSHREQQKAKAAEQANIHTPTVGEWFNIYYASLSNRPKPIKQSTLQNYKRTVSNRITAPLPPGDANLDITRLAYIPITELKKDDIYRWWDAINAEYPTITTNQRAYKCLSSAMKHAVERELIPANPVQIKTASVRVKPKEKYLPSDAELEAIMEATSPRYKVLTSLTLFHGLRIGEAIGLERRHVKVHGAVPYAPRVVVTVEQNAQRLTETLEDGSRHTYLMWQTPKTESGYRDVPIMRRHTMLFLEHLAAYEPVECEIRSTDGPRTITPLTVTAAGAPVMDTSFRSRLNTAETRAGVTTEIDPHCGRNWLITRLAEQGAHLKEIGALLGQSDLETIMKVYMKVRAGRTDTLMDKVNDSLG